MQIAGSQNSFPNLDAIAGPAATFQSAAALDPAKAIATPSLDDLNVPSEPRSLNDQIRQANKGLESIGENARFSLPPGGDNTTVNVVDSRTQEVLGSVPADRLAAQGAASWDFKGLGVNAQA